MGFIQRFKDLQYMSECTRLMKKVAPATRHTAEFFCEDYKGYLVSFKDAGAPPLEALALVSINLLNNSQELINSDMSYSEYQALIDACNFGSAIVELNHPLATKLKAPLGAFSLALQSEKGQKIWGNRTTNV